MTILNAECTALDGRKFSYNRATKTLVAEASELGRCSTFLGRIYDDACDVGIAIRSHRTNRVICYYLASEDGDGEDVAGFNFLPIPEHVRRYPECAGTSVLIIND